jgi:DNA adenine methylase
MGQSSARLSVALETRLNPTRIHGAPFIKWAGGKGQLLTKMRPFFPLRREYNRYFEPFLGGGAVFFDLAPDQAVLSDSNRELVIAYEIVRDDLKGLIELLREHEREHRRRPVHHYDKVRSLVPSSLSDVERAARMIYLNKTCYNGLYRVNRDGMFNVPMGRHLNPKICDEKTLLAANKALQGARLNAGGYADVIKGAAEDDFVYLDPPYHSAGATTTFTAYTEDGFTDQNQVELAKLYAKLDSSGCLLLLSNSDSSLVRNLYAEYTITPIEASRLITCVPSRRGTKVTELLVTNYDPPDPEKFMSLG